MKEGPVRLCMEIMESGLWEEAAGRMFIVHIKDDNPDFIRTVKGISKFMVSAIRSSDFSVHVDFLWNQLFLPKLKIPTHL